MLPFDRFVRALDEWAADNPEHDVLIQIGDGAYEPQHARWVRSVPHQEYRRLLEACDLFVAHVGMGSILQGLELRKQMLLLPRQAALREHTTEHQQHTAGKFRDTPGLLIVDDEAQLKAAISRLIREPLAPSDGLSRFAPEAFTARIADYLRGGRDPQTKG